MPDAEQPATFGFNATVPEDVVRSASEFLQRIVSPVADISDLLSDKLRFVRFRTALKTLNKARRIAEESGMTLGRVATKFLVPFLETCSVEDETSDLVDRWASLLLSAARDQQRNLNWCIRILGEIDGNQARLLDSIYRQSRNSRPSDLFSQRQANQAFAEECQQIESLNQDGLNQFDSQDGWATLFKEDDIPNTNEFHLEGFEVGEDLLQLESLGLVWVFADWILVENKRNFYVRAFLTPLGAAFVEACSPRGEGLRP